MTPTDDRLADIRRLCARWLPEQPVESVAVLGSGMDHTAYEVDGSLVVRFADMDLSVLAEAEVLAAVAPRSPLPVPLLLFADVEAACLAYRKLAGTPLMDLPAERRADHAPAIAGVLADTLVALHDLSDQLADVVGIDDPPPAEWHADAAELFASVRLELPRAARPAIERFLAAAPPAEAPRLVFSHNDLGTEHVLVDPETFEITGLIDWGDAAIVDPAYDAGLLLRDLGPAALDVAAARLDGDPGLRDRATFYARCAVLEDLAFGLEHGREVYVEKSLAALAWLFGDGAP